MSPFLLPIILILYGEKSSDKLTRYTSRVFFYIYSWVILIGLYFPFPDAVLLITCVSFVIGYSYLFVKIKFLRVRLLLGVLILLQIINYISLYTTSYTLFYMIPFYMEYSSHILRELTVMSVSLVCIEKGVDTRLKLSILGLYIIEYSYLVGI